MKPEYIIPVIFDRLFLCMEMRNIKIYAIWYLFIFIQSSPRQFNAKGREEDSDAIVAIMDDAHEFVHISVMDYMPATIYRTPSKNMLVSNFSNL